MFTIRSANSIFTRKRYALRRFSARLQADFRFCVYVHSSYVPHRGMVWYNTVTAHVSVSHTFRTTVFYVRSPLLTPPIFRPPSPPSRTARSDNAAKIILATRHATCQCNFAAISNFLGSLAFPPRRLSPFIPPRVFFRSRKGSAKKMWARNRTGGKRKGREPPEENTRVKITCILCQRTSLRIHLHCWFVSFCVLNIRIQYLLYVMRTQFPAQGCKKMIK